MEERESKISLRDLVKATLNEPEILSRLIQQKGDTFTFRAPGIKGFVFANPAYIKQILMHQPDYMRSHYATDIVKNVLGRDGLLSTNDIKIWKKDREALNPLFSKEKLKAHTDTMVKKISEQFELWKPFAEKNSAILIEYYFTQMTLANLLNTVFGGIQLDITPISPLARELFYLTSPPVFPYVKLFGKIPMPLYFRYKNARKKLHAIGDEIVKKSFDPTIGNDNLIKQLAKAYGYSSFEQLDSEMKEHLNSQALTFLLAGHDTTVALLVHICVYLSLYPMIAKKVDDEVQSVLGNREPHFDDVINLTYIQAVIRETLRLWPPGTYLLRSPQENDVINDHKIKKGDIVIIPTHAIQRLAKYWKNPEGFNPERFLKPLTQEQQLLYMPFGKGPQACIGSQFATLQTTLILAMLTQRFRLNLLSGSSLERDAGMVNRMNINILMNIQTK